MNKNSSVVIERVANGYQVRPLYGAGDCFCLLDLMVFQDMGFASAARDYQSTEDTLLGFIESHFREEKEAG